MYNHDWMKDSLASWLVLRETERKSTAYIFGSRKIVGTFSSCWKIFVQ